MVLWEDAWIFSTFSFFLLLSISVKEGNLDPGSHCFSFFAVPLLSELGFSSLSVEWPLLSPSALLWAALLAFPQSGNDSVSFALNWALS